MHVFLFADSQVCPFSDLTQTWALGREGGKGATSKKSRHFPSPPPPIDATHSPVTLRGAAKIYVFLLISALVPLPGAPNPTSMPFQHARILLLSEDDSIGIMLIGAGKGRGYPIH